jgi:lipoate-protein ligase A
LSREAELLDRVVNTPEERYLWLWQTPQCLVAPRKLCVMPGFLEASQALAESGWPIHQRSSGGDATPLGPGIVTVSHIYASETEQQFDLKDEYARLCFPIEKALGAGASHGWQPGAFCDGAYNVQWNGLKFAGTAMRFRRCKGGSSRMAVLAHALMLFEPPTPEAIEAINRFLRALGEDRHIRHDAHTGLPPGTNADEFVARLTDEFAKQSSSKLSDS